MADTGDRLIAGESAIGDTVERILRLRFDPQWPRTPLAAVEAIQAADWVLLAPGSLYTSTLATARFRRSCRRSPARPPGSCGCAISSPGKRETAGMTAEEHLSVLRNHGVRVDDVLYDPEAELHFDAGTLARNRITGFAWSLQAGGRAVHDPRLLGAALESLFEAQPSALGTVAGRERSDSDPGRSIGGPRR